MSNNFFCLFVIYFEYLFLPPKLSIKMQMTLCHHIHHSMAELNWKAPSSAAAAPSTASQKNHLKHQSSVRPSIHQFVIQSLYDCIDTKLPNAKILKANNQTKKKQIKFKFLLHYTNWMEKFTFFGYSFFLALNLTVEILCNTNALSWRFQVLISWSDVSFVVVWIFSSFASRIWTLI